MSDEATNDIAFDTADGIRAEVRKRIQLFARLRSVHRVLAPSMMSLQEDEQAQLGRTVREALDRLSKQATSLEEPNDGDRFVFSSSMRGIDEELERCHVFLLECADKVGPSQLRSTLPRLQQKHPGEVKALLELLLSNHEGIPERLPTIEYLVTLLSTRERDGRRSISHDPAMLTSEMQELAIELQRSCSIDTAEIELEFFQASSLDPGDSSATEIARSMRRKKQELGIYCLLPSVLRAIVTYNTRMFNRLHDDLEASRLSDAELRDSFDPSEQTAPIDADLGGGEWAEDLDEPRVSLDEAEGINLVHEAIVRRIRGTAIGSCSSDRVALALDLTSLQEEDVDALRHEGEADDTMDLVIKTIIIGLLLKDLAALEADLAELDLDPAQMQTDWVQELDQRLQARISDRLTSNAYDEACQLSEAKTRFLYAPLSSLNRSRTELRGEAADPVGESAGDAAGADADQNLPPLEFIEESSWSWAVHGRLAGMVATIALAVVLGIRFWPSSEPPEIHHLNNGELSSHSSYILTAYRDGGGEGGRFVGRLDSDWANVDPAERIEIAMEMVEEVIERGIRELMLYDDDLALQVHYADGTLRRPAPLDDES